ncbi:hypothetical protein HMF3257_04090 [Spirosoma telluris]|uniref:Uncharacterized protein n=1 Tax=Spirosoma telluris TaxID=2183553 RepID=A0A327NHI6_9BACT|nr:hypothetical protein HMF3257_04090 [Spirosoma telluris]
MEQIKQVLYSYFQFRAAVLRVFEDHHLPKDELKLLIVQDSNAIYRRRNNPSLWQPAEIHRLGKRLGIWDGQYNRLQSLCHLLECLPQDEQLQVYKWACLTVDKMIARSQNVNNWQSRELYKLLSWFSRKPMASQTRIRR